MGSLLYAKERPEDAWKVESTQLVLELEDSVEEGRRGGEEVVMSSAETLPLPSDRSNRTREEDFQLKKREILDENSLGE